MLNAQISVYSLVFSPLTDYSSDFFFVNNSMLSRPALNASTKSPITNWSAFSSNSAHGWILPRREYQSSNIGDDVRILSRRVTSSRGARKRASIIVLLPEPSLSLRRRILQRVRSRGTSPIASRRAYAPVRLDICFSSRSFRWFDPTGDNWWLSWPVRERPNPASRAFSMLFHDSCSREISACPDPGRHVSAPRTYPLAGGGVQDRESHFVFRFRFFANSLITCLL